MINEFLASDDEEFLASPDISSHIEDEFEGFHARSRQKPRNESEEPSETSTKRHGFSRTYTKDDGSKVAVSPAQHYAWRDPLLACLNAHEFNLMFDVSKMTPAEKNPNQQRRQGAGRPRLRYNFVGEHPLKDSHCIRPKHKWGIPIFTGRPPPKLPKLSAASHKRATPQQKAAFAQFFVANFVPWSVRSPPSLRFESWLRHAAALEDDACLHRARESDDDLEAKKYRYMACGRLSALENLIHGFQTNDATTFVLAKHRSRCRDLWPRPCDGGDPPSQEGGGKAPDDEALKCMDLLLQQAGKLRGGKPDIVDVLNGRKKKREWIESMRKGVPSRFSDTQATGVPICEFWHDAARQPPPPQEHFDSRMLLAQLKAKTSSRPVSQLDVVQV